MREKRANNAVVWMLDWHRKLLLSLKIMIIIITTTIIIIIIVFDAKQTQTCGWHP